MSLIIISEYGAIPPEDIIRKAHAANPHGWGIAYAFNKVLNNIKGIKVKDLITKLEDVKGSPYILHLHSFVYAHDESHQPIDINKNICMAHTGYVYDIPIPYKSGTSNSFQLAEFIRQLLEQYPDYFESSFFINDIRSYTKPPIEGGNENKIAFISLGVCQPAELSATIDIINIEKWTEINYDGDVIYYSDDSLFKDNTTNKPSNIIAKKDSINSSLDDDYDEIFTQEDLDIIGVYSYNPLDFEPPDGYAFTFMFRKPLLEDYYLDPIGEVKTGFEIEQVGKRLILRPINDED